MGARKKSSQEAKLSLGGAIIDAARAALITGALAFPLLALRLQTEGAHRLMLEPRWSWMAIAMVLAFAVRLIRGLWPKTPPRAKKEISESARAKREQRAKIFGAIGLAFIALWPILIMLALGPQAARKWIDNYGVQILIYVMLGWGLNIVVGLAGLLDLGYAGFYGLGAYVYALLASQFGVSFWVCLPLAGLTAALWGVLLGLPVLRLRGDYLAIVTMAFGEIIRIVLVNFDVVTNGDAGVGDFANLTFFGRSFVDGDAGVAAMLGIAYSPIQRLVFLYYLVLIFALIVNFVSLNLRQQPLGRAWEALREDEIACRSLSMNTTTIKLSAFALGAMFAGFAGVFFAARMDYVTPSSFTFQESALVLAIVVLGGRGSQIGVAIAAIALIAGTELPRELDALRGWFGADFEPSQYRMLLVGLAMVVIINWRPRGLVATRTPTVVLHGRAPIAASFIQEGRG